MTDSELRERFNKIEKQQETIHCFLYFLFLRILRTIFSDDSYVHRLAQDLASGNHNRRFAAMQAAGMDLIPIKKDMKVVGLSFIQATK